MKKSVLRMLTAAAAAAALTILSASAAFAAQNFSYADLRGLEFSFSSGVGAWETMLGIMPDGTFSGTFHDADMGDNGAGYPNGTIHSSTFTGKFSAPVKVDDYTYAAKLESISYMKTPGTQEIIDGVLYDYTGVYGLENPDRILFYLPGKPVSTLPEGYRSWAEPVLSSGSVMVLPCYGLYNEAQQEGFTSYSISAHMKEDLVWLEDYSATIDYQLQNADLSQTELNELAEQKYKVWDNVLNDMWTYLKLTLPADQMAALTRDEAAWIHAKEAQAASAAAGFQGGSMYPMVYYLQAAELTRQRAYVLVNYVK